jgi:hypothetical protein
MEQFTGQNLNNLLAFLNRVQLTGEEAPAMTDIQRKIREEMIRRQSTQGSDHKHQIPRGATPPSHGTEPSDPDPSGMDRPPKDKAEKKETH